MKDNGGPAFPGTIIAAEGQWASGPAGMTLRDLYAYKAIDKVAWLGPHDEIAKDCYAFADAMIAERGKK